jgi:uncharacterized protein
MTASRLLQGRLNAAGQAPGVDGRPSTCDSGTPDPIVEDGQWPVWALAVLFSEPEGGGMPDRETVVQRLMELNEEFRRLRAEHQAHEQELAELQARPFLSAEQQWRESELKKLKLIGKDRMEALIRQNQAAARMSA